MSRAEMRVISSRLRAYEVYRWLDFHFQFNSGSEAVENSHWVTAKRADIGPIA